jgi:hypothetical protein
LFFDTTTGVTKPERFEGVFKPSPDIDHGTLSSNGYQYAVDYKNASRDTDQGPVAGSHLDMQFGAARVDKSTPDTTDHWEHFARDISEAQVYHRAVSDAELDILLNLIWRTAGPRRGTP